MFQTVLKDSSFELTEKKSRFIACLMYVESKEEAENKIRDCKKKFHDARHNCSAYRVIDNKGIYEKSSDDGEPSGTAGAPMLNILQKNNLCNVLIVVTRYFGGILLGTGGLVRCYSDSAVGAIKLADKVIIEEGIEFQVEMDYNYLEPFKYYCRKNGISIVNIDYYEKIICRFEVENRFVKVFLKDIENKKVDVMNVKELGKKNIIVPPLRGNN